MSKPIRGLSPAETETVPDNITASFDREEFIVVMRQLALIGPRDPLRDAAKSAFAKLIRGAQERVKP